MNLEVCDVVDGNLSPLSSGLAPNPMATLLEAKIFWEINQWQKERCTIKPQKFIKFCVGKVCQWFI
jgi:hypothetical protein